MFTHAFRYIDWVLLGAALLLCGAGLVTMNSFASENSFFERQIIWILLGVAAFFAASFLEFRFLKRTSVIMGLFLGITAMLGILFVLGSVFSGAQSWFDLGLFAIQPSDPAKLVIILLLAKYFSRRHVEIAHSKHILVSGAYTLIIFLLVFLQPDFGSAIIIFLIWFGMVMVSGISKKHLVAILMLGLVSGLGLWFFAFEDYQKERIMTFLNPYTDIQGAGYNAYQSTVAVGSGELFGKGIGYGTQSKLQFLPEYETDFIFAAYSEEWGFVGVVILLALYSVVIYRILSNARYGLTNFEILFGVGLAVMFMSHIVIHVGINIGLLPVTGTTIPFMSYGGSHIVTEFAGLGILMGMNRYSRTVNRDELDQELTTEV